MGNNMIIVIDIKSIRENHCFIALFKKAEIDL